MEVRDAANAKDVKYYTTDRLREEFHISGLFTKDVVKMVYSHIDRIIVLGIYPVDAELSLEAGKELAAEYFLQRRELGCINIGGKGEIVIDGEVYEMNPRFCLLPDAELLWEDLFPRLRLLQIILLRRENQIG